MAQTVQFTPNPLAPFQFTATLDGNDYTVELLWNVYRRGYYVRVTAGNGVLVMNRALVASPADYDISLVAGLFVSTMVFREAPQVFEISP